MDIYEKELPIPALDILKEMIAPSTAAAMEQIPAKIAEGRFFTMVGDEVAYFRHELSKGDALSKDKNLDGPFIHTAFRD